MLNLDTHILIFALANQLTDAEHALLQEKEWSISGIVLWELFKLQQLGRLSLDQTELMGVVSRIRIWPIEHAVFRALSRLDFRNDPADEIIAATSVAFGIPLVTRDHRIRESTVVPLA